MFDLYFYIGLIMIILLILVVLTLIKSLSKQYRVNANIYFENFVNIWSIFCKQGSQVCLSFEIFYYLQCIVDKMLTLITDKARNLSCKISYLSANFMAFILGTYISTIILSVSVAFTSDLSFTSSEEFQKNKDYNLITVAMATDKQTLVRVKIFSLFLNCI